MTGPEPDLSTRRTLLVTVTGTDRPGLTAEIFDALALRGVEVIDLEQVVVRGSLTMAVLLSPGTEPGALAAAAHAAGRRLGLSVTCLDGTGDGGPPRPAGLNVTLIGTPLIPVAVSAIAARLAARGANIDRINRLARWPVTAVELIVSGDDVPALRRDLAEHAIVHGVDVAVSPAGLARRGRRLVVMDVDSTLIQDEVIELLAAHAGRGDQVAAITERAMRGELDFAASLHERVSVLAGLPVSVLDEVLAAVRLTPGAATLCRTLRRLGYTLAVVSGGFLEVVQPLAESLGIHYAHANRLEVRDGELTGRVLGQVVDREAKARALRRFAEAEGLPLSRTVAIGDGANDLDMLATAGLGVAFNAKPVVRRQADTSVNVPYLDVVLYLLGIPRDEVLAADGNDPEPAAIPHGAADGQR
jgi:phosphoserine phosphatase